MCCRWYRFHGKNRKRQVNSELLRRYALKYYDAVSELLNSLPSDMLLVFKTNDCLRHIDRLLGVPVNTISGKVCVWWHCYCVVVAATTADVVLWEDLSQSQSIWDVYQAVSQWCAIMTRVVGLSVGTTITSFARYGVSWYDWFLAEEVEP